MPDQPRKRLVDQRLTPASASRPVIRPASISGTASGRLTSPELANRASVGDFNRLRATPTSAGTTG
ncbi:hypothetical protein [Streptomyces daghestanicus]|uniref:hypothetical protein n=1 Tax=Streptomyces daghestanicus TaxID=66885 RepID=UPI00167EAE8C|nr:hypothetical protein [Streptomyces daghestanicus]